MSIYLACLQQRHNKKGVKFDFFKKIEINPGDVIKQKNDDQLWHVVSMENDLDGDEFVALMVNVEKEAFIENVDQHFQKKELELLKEKRHALNMGKIKETDASVKFKIDTELDEIDSEIKKRGCSNCER